MRGYTKTLLAALGLLWCTSGHADVMQMGIIMPEAQAGPLRGKYKAEVEQSFGAPERKVPAVGEPPISRWVYADYVVYFEGAVVLYSVQRLK